MNDKVILLLCKCGTNIAGVIDVEKIADEISKQNGVPCYIHDHWCSEDGLQKMREIIENEKPSRIIIAACTPHLHEELFREHAEKTGLNGGYVEVVNIREQCSWVHWQHPEQATIKAIDLIRAAIEAAPYLTPTRKVKIPVKRNALVIGGGVAGITAALNLAEKGIQVYLVEKTGFLGGHMAKLDKVFPTLDCSICILGPLLSKAYTHPNIKVLTLSEVKEVKGTPGNYKVKILKKPRYVDEEKCNGCNKCLDICPIEMPNEYNNGLGFRKAIVKPVPEMVPPAPYIDIENCIGCMSCVGVCDKEAINFEQKEEEIEINVGAIIVATGFSIIGEEELAEFGYGKFKNVILGIELERLINPDGPTKGKVVRISDGGEVKRAAIILCAGSRDERHLPYCCKFGCMAGLKHAFYLATLNPKVDVYVFYIDIRAAGKGFEEFYQRVRKLENVYFIKGIPCEIEENEDGTLKIRAFEAMIGEVLEFVVDLVVLEAGVKPAEGSKELSRILRIPLSPEGFFLEYHPKLRPSETFMRGIFLAGACQGPKDIADSVSHAGLAASKATTLLLKDNLEIEVQAPIVDHSKCIKCGLCVLSCDYNALKLTGEGLKVIEEACAGCQACIAACPTGALQTTIDLSNEAISTMIKTMLKEKKEYPLIIIFACKWCGYEALDNAGINRIPYPTGTRIIEVTCSARVNPIHILEALEQGADGVMIIGCREQDCHYRTGRTRANRKINALREALKIMGINPERVEIIGAGAPEGEEVAERITKFVEKIKDIGPLGSEFEVGNSVDQ
ncbi:MAG: disulfide reductase [Candidatus Methanomethylicota archaeon]|uniref:CoB--CoM heterodisulfide reductase iron-sulfur subunit A n=1 Tax=Thermoproteota archaeon TaxID=2056631 RepID=A0A497EXD7_9CREN|nr:MAG: disulfide reductase [Candidatus Verstraetearchaeota archaeon]